MNQTRTLHLGDFVPYRLAIASNTVSEAIAGAYRSLFALNVPDWRLMAVLAERDSSTQLELGAATWMDKVTVSRSAARLVERGLVRRAPNPLDRRSQLLSLTREGLALYAQVAPKALALKDALLKDFSPDEVERLLQMLERLRTAAGELVGPEGPSPA